MPNFVPFQKDVIFNKQAQSVILKEIQGLDFLTNSHWGLLARRVFLKLQLMMQPEFAKKWEFMMANYSTVSFISDKMSKDFFKKLECPLLIKA